MSRNSSYQTQASVRIQSSSGNVNCGSLEARVGMGFEGCRNPQMAPRDPASWVCEGWNSYPQSWLLFCSCILAIVSGLQRLLKSSRVVSPYKEPCSLEPDYFRPTGRWGYLERASFSLTRNPATHGLYLSLSLELSLLAKVKSFLQASGFAPVKRRS